MTKFNTTAAIQIRCAKAELAAKLAEVFPAADEDQAYEIRGLVRVARRHEDTFRAYSRELDAEIIAS